MGILFEDLKDHEGYAARRLPDGTLTSSWPAGNREFDSYVAACGCGWRGPAHPPTEEGQEAAEDAWEAQHARPLLRNRVPTTVRDMMTEVRRAVLTLAKERPLAALSVLEELDRWSAVVSDLATETAHRQGDNIFPHPHRRPGRSGPSLGL